MTSIQPNEHNSFGADKMSRYSWSIQDGPGRLMLINKHALDLDMSYQREVKDSDAKIKRIASEWSWLACGALIVADRGDGKLFVIDGQHRVRAAMKLSAVSELPCIVFKTVGVEEEAAAFLRANKNRAPMKAIQSFKAMVKCGDKDAVFVKHLLEQYGLHVAPGGTSPHAFQAPGVLLALAKRDHGHARRVIAASIAACSGHQLHNEIMKGLSWIDSASGDDELLAKMQDRLRQLGREEILRAIVSAKAFRGVGGDKVCGEGILNVYNKRLRNKIEIA